MKTTSSLVMAILVSIVTAGAQELVKASGHRAGLIAHVGVTGGKLTAELAGAGNFIVHGLAADDAAVAKARKFLRGKGLYGRVSVDKSSFKRLPYAPGIVTLLVIGSSASGKVSSDEIHRVLAADGVVCYQGGALAKVNGCKPLGKTGGWTLLRKPRPAGMDDFTHHNYDASCNRVGRDTLGEVPFGIRWLDGPGWTTSGSGPITMVSAAGRIFTGVQESYRFGNKKVSRIYITARDAYNGKVLWKKRAQGFRALTAIATKDVFYATLKPKAGPLVALDAITGEVERTYTQAGAAEWAVSIGDRLVIGAGVKGGVKCVDAASGKVLWTSKRAVAGCKKTPNVAVDVKKGELYFAQFVRKSKSPPTLGCLDLASGKEKWTAKAEKFPTTAKKGKGTGLSAYSAEHGVIILGIGSAFEGGGAFAYSTKDGKHLWTADYRLVCSGRPARHKGSSYVDGYFIDGLFWIFAGRGNYKKKAETKAAGPRQAIGWHGHDPKTGKVVKKLDLKKDEYVGDSCHRTNASLKYFLGGHSKFMDRKTGRLLPRSHSIHNGCYFGMLPANGMWYTSSIYTNQFVMGEIGLSGKRTGERDDPKAPGRLVKGPGSAGGAAATSADWPCFRANPLRSGANAAKAPGKFEELWAVKLSSRLGPPTAAGNTAFVADLDGLRVLAVDAKSGKLKWSYDTGGRTHVPPTYYKGTVLFGDGLGWVHCVNAQSGKLVWKYRATPLEDRIVVRERLESVWPVLSGVVVIDGLALFAAGRGGSLDGGGEVYALKADTGALVWNKRESMAIAMRLSVCDGKNFLLGSKSRYSVKGGGPAGSLKGAAFNPDVIGTARLGKAGSAKILPQIQLRAVARAGELTFTAGPPALKAAKRRRSKGGVVNYPEDNPEMKECIVNSFSANGAKIASVKLDALAVFDGMCVAGDKLFLSTQDGKLRCFGKK